MSYRGRSAEKKQQRDVNAQILAKVFGDFLRFPKNGIPEKTKTLLATSQRFSFSFYFDSTATYKIVDYFSIMLITIRIPFF